MAAMDMVVVTQITPMNLHTAGVAGAIQIMAGAGVTDMAGTMADGVTGTLGMVADGIMAADCTEAVMTSQPVTVDSMVAGMLVVADTQWRTQAVADTIAADPDWASNPTRKIV